MRGNSNSGLRPNRSHSAPPTSANTSVTTPSTTMALIATSGDSLSVEMGYAVICYADIVSFLALKGLAMQREERKDAADLVYVLRSCGSRLQELAQTYAQRLADATHGPSLHAALAMLLNTSSTTATPPAI